MGYLGSKDVSGLWQAIIAAMPPHDTYIETHLGSGVVLRRKPPAARQVGIDRDPAALAGFAAAGIPEDVELVEGDAIAWLERFDFRAAGRVLIYADPPYLHATRSGLARHRYRFEMTDADHQALLEVLEQVPAAVILSGYPNALYDAALPGWRTVEMQAMTRGGVRTEKLWMNFDADAGAHWATYAGANRTRRQNIKRKAQRWAEHFERLSAGERAAVLGALLAVQPAAAARDRLQPRPAASAAAAAAGCEIFANLVPQPDPASEAFAAAPGCTAGAAAAGACARRRAQPVPATDVAADGPGPRQRPAQPDFGHKKTAGPAPEQGRGRRRAVRGPL